MKNDTKLICGIPHKRMPCCLCGEMIWVSVAKKMNAVATKKTTCNSCFEHAVDGGESSVMAVVQAGMQRRVPKHRSLYHGDDGRWWKR